MPYGGQGDFQELVLSFPLCGFQVRDSTQACATAC